MVSKKILLISALILFLSLLLSACQTYQGYPTEVIEPTIQNTKLVKSSPEVRAALPLPPTFTPRPDLPPAPGGIKPQKLELLKQGLDALRTKYFRSLESADVFEVALLAMQTSLAQSGISSPSVPLPQFGKQDNENWNLFQQAYSIVLDKYQGKVSEDKLVQFALLGVTNSLQDCQTAYYPPDRAENYAKTRYGLTQTLVGIGINLQSGQDNAGNNVHVLTRVVGGGPAEKAGLKMGDRIKKVEGQDTSNKTTSEVIQLLGGAVSGDAAIGTKLNLTVQRGNQEQAINLSRARVAIPFMEQQTLAGNIGYIKFNRFPFLEQQAATSAQNLLQTWLTEFNKANVNGFVIDLRGNSAGNLTMVITALSFFISGQKLVYMSGVEQDQTGPTSYGVFSFFSDKNIQATDKPISIIVDGGTSGEAEIFAYAIQRNKRGSIVGTTTAGCATASEPVFLDNNSLLNITVFRAIANQGLEESILTPVEPDKEIALDLQQLTQGKDNQIEAAIAALKK